MKPREVNPRNFKIKYILLENSDFSIAYGDWNQSEFCLAMRWNGEENNAGYPKTFGHPVWFIIPKSMTFVLAKSLLEFDDADKQSVILLLNELIKL
jgi:hypothetical protein